MIAQVVSAAIALFAAGARAGIIGVVCLAIRRDKHLTLTGEAPGTVTRAGRLLTGVGVRTPRRAAPTGRETTHA